MMNPLYPTVTSAKLKGNPAAVFRMAKEVPVVISSYSEPQVICVNPEQWNATAKKLAELESINAALERIIEYDRRSREMDEDPTMKLLASLEEHARQGIFDG